VRAAVLLLLLANVALFAWRQGSLGPAVEAGREPQRLERQVAPEKLRLLSPAQLAALRATPQAAEAPGQPPACLEIGDFDDASLARIQARLGELGLGDRLQPRRIDAPSWYVVYLPAAASRAEAERAAQDLRARGVRDLLVQGPGSPLPNSILLGSFRDPELAQRHQADLAARGVRNVRLAERSGGAEWTRFEIRDVDVALAVRLAEIQKEFPQSRIGACGS
jgi:cell division protein FtsN